MTRAQRLLLKTAVRACLASIAAVAFLHPGIVHGQSRPLTPDALLPNTLLVRAGAKQGFGFVVGVSNKQMIVATALHTVDHEGGDSPEVCFAPNGERCVKGRLAYAADATGALTALDLAFITIPYPDALPWRTDVWARRTSAGASVRTIGRGSDWYVPARAGRVSAVDLASSLLTYIGLDVTTGVSGAPVVSDAGIVAMHVQELGSPAGARGITIDAIRQRLELYAPGSWALVHPADCAAHAALRSDMEGRDVVVRFRVAALQTAVTAAAQLSCLGARARLAPAWESSGFSGDEILYRSGELPTVRAIQAVLGSVGRLPGRLSPQSTVLEVRIP
ncbi:MAG: hypothetical protein IT354_13400 [Gemmatimonadaceae bacterium]|nr:hypothetical protein [Gemmatimonadaceae bacterium]